MRGRSLGIEHSRTKPTLRVDPRQLFAWRMAGQISAFGPPHGLQKRRHRTMDLHPEKEQEY